MLSLIIHGSSLQREDALLLWLTCLGIARLCLVIYWIPVGDKFLLTWWPECIDWSQPHPFKEKREATADVPLEIYKGLIAVYLLRQDKSEHLNSVRTSKLREKHVYVWWPLLCLRSKVNCDWNPCLIEPSETLKIGGERKLTLIDHHSKGKMQLIVEGIWLPMLCAMKTLQNENCRPLDDEVIYVDQSKDENTLKLL